MIQAGVRCAIATARYRRAISAVIDIQTWWRGAAAVASYRKELHPVVVIQAGVRCAIATARYRRAISAVTDIQTRWRGAAAVGSATAAAPRHQVWMSVTAEIARR